MAHELMTELIKKGNTVTVLTRQIDNMGSIDATGDMRIIRYRMPKRQVYYPVAVWRTNRLVRQLLTNEQFDLINILFEKLDNVHSI